MSSTDEAWANSKIMQLKDGRKLGYVEYGNPQGPVLFYFHGHPSSRVEARFVAEVARQKGVRLIGVDRPGMGFSSYKPNRQILDWPNDMLDLADYLQIKRFAVVGFSGGGPYALACAYKIPDRLSACGIVSGVGDPGRFVSFLSRWLPWLVLPLTRRFLRTKEQATRTLNRLARNWVAPDRKALFEDGASETLAASLVEGLRQGSRGAGYDGTLIGSQDWGFEVESITFPQLHLWHGELDKSVPITQGRKLAERLKTCKAKYYSNEGHISIVVNHAPEIVTTLTADLIE